MTPPTPTDRLTQITERAATINIEMAARGCISGTLAEWPVLNAELREHGIDLPLETHSTTLSALCRTVMLVASQAAEIDATERALNRAGIATRDPWNKRTVNNSEAVEQLADEADRLRAEIDRLKSGIHA